MSVFAFLLSGAFAGLVVFVIARHLGGEPLVALGAAGGTFIAASSLVMKIQEKFGYL